MVISLGALGALGVFLLTQHATQAPVHRHTMMMMPRGMAINSTTTTTTTPMTILMDVDSPLLTSLSVQK